MEAHQNAQAAIVFGDAATLGQTVTDIAAKRRVPIMYGVRSFVRNLYYVKIRFRFIHHGSVLVHDRQIYPKRS